MEFGKVGNDENVALLRRGQSKQKNVGDGECAMYC